MTQHLISRRRSASLGFVATCAAAAAAVHGADVTSTWIDQPAGSGNWNNTTNWSNAPAVAQFPNNGNGGFTYDAILNGFNTITLGQNITLENLTLDDVTLVGANSLTINDHFRWTGGQLRHDQTTIQPGATFELDSIGRVWLTGNFDNFGVATWSTGGTTGDQFAALGVFHNRAGATFYANNSFEPQAAFGIGSFINSGTVLKTAGAESRFGGVTRISNTGTFHVQTGMIRCVFLIEQYSEGALTGGSWIVDATNSPVDPVTLQLNAVSAGLTTIGAAARVEMLGANSVFLPLEGLTTNAGHLRFANGRKFTAQTGLTNSGTTVIQNGSALRVVGELANTGTIDVSNNAGMLVDYEAARGSPLSAIVAQIVNARNAGNWDQSGITSSAARDANPSNTTLGVLEGSEYLVLNGPGATFFDFAVDDSSVLVGYSLYGDTDFNGVVNFDDYARIDAGFNNNRTGWLNGDFDLNGIVNFDDYSLIDLAFNTQGGGAMQLVPEPAAALLGGCVVCLSRLSYGSRRRR